MYKLADHIVFQNVHVLKSLDDVTYMCIVQINQVR
jgi:hypothetical protein